MKILDKGHVYKLDTLDGEIEIILTFVKRFRGVENHSGTTIQDVLKCLIDRTKVLHDEKPHVQNEQIIQHLRMALVLYETRALERKVEKEELHPEFVQSSCEDGHFLFKIIE